MTAQISESSFFSKNPALKIKEFNYLLVIRFALIFALNMQSATIYYWIFDLTNSKLNLGFIGLAEVIPAVGFSLFAGYLVDLKEKRKILSYCLGGYLGIALLLFILTHPSTIGSMGLKVSLIFIYACVFIGGIIRSFLGPASFSLLALIVPKQHIPNATSWSSIAFQIGAVLGPLLSGLMIYWKGIEFTMAAVFFVEVLPFIAILLIKAKPIIPQKKAGMLANLSEGLKFVFKTPTLLGAMSLDLFSVLFGGAVALLPVFQKEILHVDEKGFGILRAAPGIGALVTMGLLTIFPLKKNPGVKLFVCVFGFGLSIIIFGLSKNFWLSFAMLVCTGLFDAVSVVIRSTILQLLTPDEMRGRVSAVNTMFISSSNELGDFESGLMANWLGPVRAVVVGGSLTILVVIVTFFKTPQLKKFTFNTAEDDA